MRSGSPIDDAKCIASYVQVCQKIYKEHKDTCNKVSLLYILIQIWFNLLQKVAKNICNSKESFSVVIEFQWFFIEIFCRSLKYDALWLDCSLSVICLGESSGGSQDSSSAHFFVDSTNACRYILRIKHPMKNNFFADFFNILVYSVKQIVNTAYFNQT